MSDNSGSTAVACGLDEPCGHPATYCVCKPSRPEPEMMSEDEPKAWLRKDCYPTRAKAKQWAVGEFGIDWIDLRVRTTWIRGLLPSEGDDYPDWGGMGCAKDCPGAEEFWEVRDRRVS
jgi:hypothetical protein